MEFLTSLIGSFRYPGSTEIKLTKGYCTPARDHILTALQPYGVRVLGISESIVYSGLQPQAINASVWIGRSQAQWAEYLLLRTQTFKLRGRLINRRNQEWAHRHDRRMPTPWSSKPAKPWIEQGCKLPPGKRRR